MPSRRHVLAGAGAAVGALYAGANAIRIGSVEVDPVPSNTWPLARRDYRNTAASTGRIPGELTIAWTAESVGSDYPSGLVVGEDRVYAGGDRLLVLDRVDGTEHWPDAGPGR